MRIVSLLPSATEIVAALGFREQLVGRSHECDFPAWVQSRPILTKPAFSPERNSREIDQSVKGLVEQGLSLYRVDADLLKSLAPDFIVTQTQCEVCAVSEGELKKALGEWCDSEAKIISLKPDALADLWADIQRTADQLGASPQGSSLVENLSHRLADLAAQALALPRPSVACLEWLDPLMAAGNWMPELVKMAGGRNLFGEAGKHSPWLSWEGLKAANPETIVLLPCGYDLPKLKSCMYEVSGHPDWEKLQAVRAGRVYLVDGNQYFNRPGPRLVESLEILAEILHPEVFDFGHRGIAWETMSL